MREVTASGQTVEEAVQSALEQLNTTEDHVEVSVIDEGKKGLFGLFGAKPAIVKVEIEKDPVEEAEMYIKNIIREMNIDAQVTTTVSSSGNHITYDLSGEKVAILIGKRGQTLNALQYLIHLAINKDGKAYYTVTLDAEGYRSRRKETLKVLAERMAERAKRIQRKVALDPMPAYERKIIHSSLQEIKDIKTYSEGTEPHRHIVIKP